MANATKYHNQLTPAREYIFQVAQIKFNMNVKREEKKQAST